MSSGQLWSTNTSVNFSNWLSHSLLSAIEGLEEKINSQPEAGLSLIRQQVSDTAQRRQVELVYGKFSHQMYVPELRVQHRGGRRLSSPNPSPNC